MNTLDRVLNAPPVNERGVVHEVYDPRHPEYGGGMTMGNPIKMSAMSEESFAHPPALAEHCEEILVNLLGHAPTRGGAA